jgi:23S rRNA (uridine2552-2'-O)-methyltransferase
MPQQRKLHDEFFKRAKAEGYLARSAYKLLEMNERKRLIRHDDAVLDLGCAPGSWLQVAAKEVGPGGVVVGIDLQEIRHRFPDNVHVLQGDIYKTPPEVLLGGMGQPFDVVISDMAPNTSGHGDDFLSVRLCRRMIELLPELLKRGGHCAMKVLEGSEFPELLREVKALFREAGGFKPEASRDVSREMFIWAKGYKGPPARKINSAEKKVEPVVPIIIPAGNPLGWEVAPRPIAEPAAKPARKPAKKTVKKKGTGKKTRKAKPS